MRGSCCRRSPRSTSTGPVQTPVSGKDNPFNRIMSPFDHARIPDGLFQVIMPSMIDPGLVVIDMIRLFTLPNGVKGIH